MADAVLQAAIAIDTTIAEVATEEADDTMTVVLLEVGMTTTNDEATEAAVMVVADATETTATAEVASIDTRAAADVMTATADVIDEEAVGTAVAALATSDEMIEVVIVGMVAAHLLLAMKLLVTLTAAAVSTMLLVKIDMLEDRWIRHLFIHECIRHDRSPVATDLISRW